MRNRNVINIDAHHSLAQTARNLRDGRRVFIVLGGLYNGACALLGVADLKIPDPTNTPSAPSCIIIAACGGRRNATSGKQHYGKLARFGYLANQLRRVPDSSLAAT